MKLNSLLFVIAGVVVLGGLFFFFKLNSPQINPPQTSTKTLTEGPKIKTFMLVVKDKKIVKGADTIKVNQGEEITIHVTSDTVEEFHIHGYDKSVELEPDKQATLTFRTELSGRFPFELEESKTELGVLEVQPQQ